jgi:hypothetical protein
MGIIFETSCKQIEVSYLMWCENAHMWHDHACQGHTLVTLIAKYIYTSCNVVTQNWSAIAKKSNMVDYNHIYMHTFHHISVTLATNLQLQYNFLFFLRQQFY